MCRCAVLTRGHHSGRLVAVFGAQDRLVALPMPLRGGLPLMRVAVKILLGQEAQFHYLGDLLRPLEVPAVEVEE